MRSWALILAVVALAPAVSANPLFGRAKAYKTVSTDQYEVIVQRNGRTDVNLIQGHRVFDNAYPMVQFANRDKPRPLRIDGRLAVRDPVAGPLGDGQGMVVSMRGCEWHLRAYPTRPFITVQLVFINDSRRPVQVSKLIPWAVGGSRRGALGMGPGAADAWVLHDHDASPGVGPGVTRGGVQDAQRIALYNPVSGRSLVAAFLTEGEGRAEFELDRGSGAPDDGFDRFSAACVYDPPVEVEPGAAFASELLYLAVSEGGPLEALEGYGRALAELHGGTDRTARSTPPHGWDPWHTSLGGTPSEAALLEDLAVASRELKRYGWTHFDVGRGWARAPGDWEPNERFPRGMAWLAGQIRDRGLTAGLWVSPFAVDPAAPLAQAHPDWVVPPTAAGRERFGDDTLILDITAPGAYGHVVALCRKITQEWGFDALLLDDALAVLQHAGSYHDPRATRVSAMRLGLRAIREGAGPGAVLSTGGPLVLAGEYADAVRVAGAARPVWDAGASPDGGPGAVQALTRAARRYHLAPYLTPDPGTVFFGHADTRERWGVPEAAALTNDQQIAWLTGAALLGGTVRLGTRFSSLEAHELSLLRSVLPSLGRSARPVDLFQEGAPRVWVLPVHAGGTRGPLAGVFNWDAHATRSVALDFRTMTLDPGGYYTVYEFWTETYHGAAREQLDVQLPPGSARLYALRPYRDRPMFLATNRHFSMGAAELKALDWDAGAKTLRATLDTVSGTEYAVRFLVPAPYRVVDVGVAEKDVAYSMDGEVLVVRFQSGTGGPVAFTLEFARGDADANS